MNRACRFTSTCAAAAKGDLGAAADLIDTLRERQCEVLRPDFRILDPARQQQDHEGKLGRAHGVVLFGADAQAAYATIDLNRTSSPSVRRRRPRGQVCTASASHLPSSNGYLEAVASRHRNGTECGTMMPSTAPQYWVIPSPVCVPSTRKTHICFSDVKRKCASCWRAWPTSASSRSSACPAAESRRSVRAGLIPALRRGKLSGAGVRWKVAVMRPGGDPFAALAAALNDPGALGPSATREATLRASSFGLLHAGKEGRKPEQNLLVVVDQFEEIFRLRDDFGQRWSKAVDFVSCIACHRPRLPAGIRHVRRPDHAIRLPGRLRAVQRLARSPEPRAVPGASSSGRRLVSSAAQAGGAGGNTDGRTALAAVDG